ncbi:MAG: hypothetical protein R2688_04855 [Fimbriimonadaceae bacterium]
MSSEDQRLIESEEEMEEVLMLALRSEHVDTADLAQRLTQIADEAGISPQQLEIAKQQFAERKRHRVSDQMEKDLLDEDFRRFGMWVRELLILHLFIGFTANLGMWAMATKAKIDPAFQQVFFGIWIMLFIVHLAYYFKMTTDKGTKAFAEFREGRERRRRIRREGLDG